MELLLFEDPLDRAHPGAVGAAADVFELVAGAPIHAEVEEDEIGPGLDRIVEDVHPLIARDARGPDIRVRLDAHREDLVVPADVALDVEAEVGEQTVHECGVSQIVLHDLGDDGLLLDRRRLGDPGHVAVAPCQLRVGLHGQEVDEVLAIVVGHFVGGLDAHARLDLRQHLASQVAHGCLLQSPRIPYRRSITRTALPSERGSVRGATIVSWTERPIAFWRRSATRRRRLAITGCSASKPPQRSTSSGPGSTCTSRVARVERRSTTGRKWSSWMWSPARTSHSPATPGPMISESPYTS